MAPIIIPKNGRESFRVSWEEFQGHRFLDLRVYFDPGSGELKPSRKGVAISPASLQAVIEALQAAQEEATNDA